MRNLKKFLALVLAMMMVFSLMVTVNAADTSVTQAEAVDLLVLYGVLEGYDNGLHLDASITRAQMAAIVYRIMTGDTSGAGNDTSIENYGVYARKFTDVNKAAWAEGYIGFCANHDILVGFGDGTVRPNEQITGYQVLAMLLRALGHGLNGEYEGKNWTSEVLYDATQYRIYAGAYEVGQDPSKPAPRGTVAVMTYNAINNTTIAAGPSKGRHLITHTSSTGDDIWGAPATNYVISFNWYETPITNEKSVEDKPIITYYGPVTECDVAEDTGIDGVTLTTYTNGIGNKSSQYIDELATTTYIGANGREARVYADRIVYRDMVLAQAGTVNQAVFDTANHVYRPASTSVTVYYNMDMDGLATINMDNGVRNDAGPTNYADTANYSVAGGNYTRGQFMMAHILTGTTNNDVDGPNPPIKPTGGAYTGDRLRDATVITPVNVTVAAISYDGTVGGNQVIGFIGADGAEYRYSVSYGYYGGGYTDETANVLTNTAIGKTYGVYVYTAGGVNYVLGIEPDVTTTGYGVVTGFKTVSLGTAFSGQVQYAVDYEIFTEDSNTITVRGTLNGNAANYGYVGEAAAITYASSLVNKLVSYTDNANNKYSTVTIAPNNGLVPNANNTLGGGVQIGDADALQVGTVLNGAAPLMNNNTTIFVANYTMDNSLNQGVGGYVLSGYSVYDGFQALPYDLKDGGVAIYEGETRVAPGNNIRWYAFGTGYASYVLILDGTERSNNVVEDVPSYAYVRYTREMYDAYQDYYRFNVLLNGSGTYLQMANTSAAAGNVQANGSGLYIYSEATNGTYGKVVGPVNHVTATNNWTYTGGVLALTTPLPCLNSTPANAPYAFKSGTNLKYMTVTADTQIYIVNSSTGVAYPTSASLTTLQSVYGNELYFQLNQYGWINFIYFMDNTTPTSASELLTVNVTNNVPAAKGTLISAVEKGLTVNTTGGTGTTNVSVSLKVEVLNASGNFVTYTGEAFAAGTYRYVITIAPKSGFYMSNNTVVSVSGMTANAAIPNGATVVTTTAFTI